MVAELKGRLKHKLSAQITDKYRWVAGQSNGSWNMNLTLPNALKNSVGHNIGHLARG